MKINNSYPYFIFITGGVTSSLGKGVLAASLGKLMINRGFKTTIQKLDPYINIDPGTMNPYEHGEVYVTKDGAETDLDLGHYERFLNISLTHKSNFTTGGIYSTVLKKERKGEFLGKTIQVIPHITDEIKFNIYNITQNPQIDIAIIEIGGTVGDIEGLPFLEAVRQIRYELPHKHTLLIHLTLVPYLQVTGELKTKPTQHSIKMLLQGGLIPDIIACRCDRLLPSSLKEKLGHLCGVREENVIPIQDTSCIYNVPLMIHKENLDIQILKRFELSSPRPLDLKKWKKNIDAITLPKTRVSMALIGKYVDYRQAYVSINEALIHAGAKIQTKVDIQWINSGNINQQNYKEILSGFNGLLSAPGFGDRGFEGKILTSLYARTTKTPFLGLCLGMQAALIDIARNLCGITKASSTEFDPQTSQPIIDLMESQKNTSKKGGTMRLGEYDCEIMLGSLTYQIYQQKCVRERHRHRYEFNNTYKKQLENQGILFSGINPQKKLVEIIELTHHPWFIGSQFHPEFASTLYNPHPLFLHFIKALIQHARK